MEKNSISILIAAYNEEGNIASAIEKLKNVMPFAEIIIVDDGSSDETFTKANTFKSSSIKVISTCHKGKGYSIKRAIEEASGEIMVQIDTDLQFPAEGIPSLVQPILEKKADIVFGSRYLDTTKLERNSVSLIKRLGSLILASIISIICKQRFTDVFAGFKAWKTKAIRDINIQENGFAYEAEIAIKAKRLGYKVVEVPTAYRRRIAGYSKIRLLRHSVEIPWRIFRIILSS